MGRPTEPNPTRSISHIQRPGWAPRQRALRGLSCWPPANGTTVMLGGHREGKMAGPSSRPPCRPQRGPLCLDNRYVAVYNPWRLPVLSGQRSWVLLSSRPFPRSCSADSRDLGKGRMIAIAMNSSRRSREKTSSLDGFSQIYLLIAALRIISKGWGH